MMMNEVIKVADDLGHGVFVRPIFEPVNVNDIAPTERARTANVHVLDSGAISNGVSLPFNIITWATGMTERTAQLERQTAQLRKCAVCMENDKARVLHCGHRFCAACIRQVKAAATGGPVCPICRQDLVALAGF
jgi:hypothetical protein